MNDKKASDDEFFEDDFNEDINFDEENFDAPANVKPSSSTGGGGTGKGPGKKPIIGAIVLSVLITLGYYGYKFYNTEKPKSESVPLIAQVPVKPAAKPEVKPETKAEVKSTTPKPVTPTPTVKAPDTTTKPSPAPTAAAKGEAPKAPSFDDKDLEKFLGSAAPEKPDTKAAPGSVTTTAAPTNQPPTIVGTVVGTKFVPPAETKTPIASPSLEAKTVTSSVPIPDKEGSTAAVVSKPIQPAQQVTSITTPAEKSSTIQEMQKDLFAEKPLVKEIKPSEMAKAPLIPAVAPPSTENQQIKEIKDQTKEAMEALSRLNQQMESNLSQIKSLDAYTRDVSQTVAKLNSDISAMDNRLLALTNAATSLSKDIGSVRSEVGTVRRTLKEDTLDVSTVPRRRVEAPTITVEEPEYVVHAVIPGRAWIKSTKGQILTVSEGDSLGNYGKVLVIDATNGVVLTSSGVAFR